MTEVTVVTPQGERTVAAVNEVRFTWPSTVEHRYVGELPPDVAELLLQYADVEHYFLPQQLEDELRLIEEERVADCLSASYAIHRAATARGIRSRRGWGLLVSAPFSIEHAWIEFEIGDQWVPVDLLLAGALIRWGLTDEPLLELAVKMGALFCRLGDERTPIMRIGRDALSPSFWTALDGPQRTDG